MIIFYRLWYIYFLLAFSALFLVSCHTDKTTGLKNSEKIFSQIDPSYSGVNFSNEIIENKNINYFRYNYLYNGGGVGIGDINNDNLPDIYFTSTQGFDKLYLNKGSFEFEDISKTAGIDQYPGVKTGVNFIDINNDGWLDIYVCRSGWSGVTRDRENLLFINNKDNTFAEKGASFGLNADNLSVQSVFFDFDKDGDLDLFLSNHPNKFLQNLGELIENVNNPDESNSDKLYRNNGDQSYTEIGQQAGIFNYTYGLGVVAGDLNNDGWTDLYCTSDFQPRDQYFVNNKNGSFTESLEKYFPHCSYFTMGVDLVDINGDGHLDVFTGEMLSEENSRQKTNMASMDMDFFKKMVENGMYYQYMRNAFHINNGNGHFSDMAHYSGIDKTDWSWSSLFGDYDHDGDNDLLVVNGWLKDTQDKDFTPKFKELAEEYGANLKFEQAHELLKTTPLKNYAYEYKSDLQFEKVSDKWGFDFEGFSHGMAYGDLDNDGDLDVVINNINSAATIYKNNVDDNNFLKIKLKGPSGNINGLNTKLTLTTDSGIQYKEFQVIRGFQSSCEPFVHFGLKENSKLIKLEIQWPNDQIQLIQNPKPGKLIVEYKNSYKNSEPKVLPNPVFEEVSIEGLEFKHQDAYFDDYQVQVLIPHQLSQLGPALAVGDVNNDGMEDIFVGGAHDQPSQIFLQNVNGDFQLLSVVAFDLDKKYEDVSATFLDVNGDNFIDLLVSSCSYQFEEKSILTTSRIYLNNKGKNFVKKISGFLSPNNNAACVKAIDYDNDGDVDLFIGGRIISAKYPFPASSHLLINENNNFVDRSENLAPGFKNIGMVTDAEWTDYDNDKDLDLIVVGEWMDIYIFENIDGRLEMNKDLLPDQLVGWWNTIQEVDLDNDGDMDYLVGNLGENYKYKTSAASPFQIFADDFDGNGRYDIVLSYMHASKALPVRGFQCSSEQIPNLKKKITSYEEFGNSDIYQVYGKKLDKALHYTANSFKSIILWNEKDKLIPENLPYQLQTFPIQDFVILDFNNDGFKDIVAAGNWYVSEIETPRADNGVGVVLKNNGNKTFTNLTWSQSGFFASKDVRSLALVKGENTSPKIVVGNNNDSLQVFSLLNSN